MDVLEKRSQQLLNARKSESETPQCVYKKLLLAVKSEPNVTEYVCPDFENGLSWFNTKAALSFQGNLKGKVVVLDFWTYCCINCMHILPDLHELEQQYSVEDGLVIIGVHSAKFANEKVDENVANAVHRYKISHAVVNDSQMSMWNQLGISCWPTLVVVGPDGKLLNQFVGEGNNTQLIEFISCALDVYRDQIDNRPLPISIGGSVPSSALCYPTKVLATEDLIISDSGHHRVVVCTLDGQVKAVVGSGKPGFKDGSFEEAEFTTPQGLCRLNDVIYVADSDTHHIRTIDLSTSTVGTLTGQGVQGNDRKGGNKGQHQVISSPWDVKLYRIDPDPSLRPQCCLMQLVRKISGDEESLKLLLVAMAGTHQIWSYFFTETEWWKGIVYDSATCVAIVGSGSEENRNNSYPMKAGLAQPSGLSIDLGKHMCYIADSESSTVRQLNLKVGQVKGMAGGAIDPKDLFSYGDSDGKGVDAKLQHPLDVCHIANTDHVIICDSYNHKLKLLNTKTRQVTTLSVAGLSEPGGLSYHQPSSTLYIADTNNHCIKRIPLPDVVNAESELNVEQLHIEIDMADAADAESQPLFDRNGKSVIKEIKGTVTISSVEKTLTLEYQLPASCSLTEEVDSLFRATSSADPSKETSGQIKAKSSDNPSIIRIVVDIGSLPKAPKFELTVELIAFFCSSVDKTCRRQFVLITQAVEMVA